MFTWIISTAQHARPKVIHHSEPVRAQVKRSSAVVTMKPFEMLPVNVTGNEPGKPRHLLFGGHAVFVGAEHHSHSRAPFFHAYARPRPSSARKIIMAIQPVHLVKSRLTAHGNRKAASRSKTMNRIATR